MADVDGPGAPAPKPINKTQEELVKKVRKFLQDTKAKNRLDPDFEIDDDEIRLGLDLTLDDFNTSPPIIAQRTYAQLPSMSIMIWGAVIQCLIMASIRAERNYLPFQAGNVGTALPNRSPGYQSLIGQLKVQYDQAKISLKTTINMEEGFGFISSPYANTEGPDFEY